MTSRKQRAHTALRWYRRNLNNHYPYNLPPSVVIAVSHDINPHAFPLMSRRQWKKMKDYT